MAQIERWRQASTLLRFLLSKECNQYSLSRSESFTKLLIEEFDHGSD